MAAELGNGGVARSFAYTVRDQKWCWSALLRELLRIDDVGPGGAGQGVVDVVAEDLAAARSVFQDAIEHTGSFSFTLRLREAPERMRRVVVAAHSICQDAAVTEVSGFLVDITETLHESERYAVEASSVHRASIEQAKGAVMFSFGIPEDAAFEVLRGVSNRHNTKLSLIAERIVARLHDPVFFRDDPVRCLLNILKTLDLPEPWEASHSTSSRSGMGAGSLSG